MTVVLCNLVTRPLENDDGLLDRSEFSRRRKGLRKTASLVWREALFLAPRGKTCAERQTDRDSPV